MIQHVLEFYLFIRDDITSVFVLEIHGQVLIVLNNQVTSLETLSHTTASLFKSADANIEKSGE